MISLTSFSLFDILCLCLFLFIRPYPVSCKMEGRIVEGVPVPIEKFPYAVQVFNKGSLCGGSILSTWVILTAAHCFDNNRNIPEVHIRYGVRNTFDKNAPSHPIWYFVLHEKFNKQAPFACDIALLFTKEPIKFSNTVQKVFLVDNKRWMKAFDHNFTATGWGFTSEGGQISNKGLMETYLTLVPDKKCKEMTKPTKITRDMFCLYGDGVRDTCQGDSGSAILWHGFVVGLVSHGEGCARKGKPGVYANVYYFLPWIQKKTKEAYKKYCDHPPTNYV